MNSEVERAVAEDLLASPDTELRELVEAVRALPYGRPSDRTVEGMLRERRGTCSTKHLFLSQILTERFPDTRPQIVHRVYRLDRPLAGEMFGVQIAACIPIEGLVDVHRYLTIALDEQRIVVDATFPGEPWDGCSSMQLACGPGTDHPGGEQPNAEKHALEQQYCDPLAREPFIAALESQSRPCSGCAIDRLRAE